MKETRWFLRVMAAALLALGCSSSSKDSKTTEPELPPIDLTVKGANVLGVGTDVFGAYAVEGNVKGRILDLAAMNAAGLLVYNPDVQEYKYEEAAGNTVTEYTSHLAASVGLSGSYKFFSAEVKASFANDSYRRDDYSYASIMERHWQHAVRVAPGVWGSGTHLRPYLTTLARQAVDDTDPLKKWTGAEVIAAYGTHVMNGVYVGGRLDYHLAVQILAEEDRTLLSAYAKASYNSMFASAALEGGLDTENTKRMDAYNRVGPIINAKGGAAQYAHPENDDQYKLWKASLDTNPVFCGIIDGGLLPIWELAGTPARRQEILSAFEAYAATQAAAFVPLLQKITDIRVVDAGQGTSVTFPSADYRLLRSKSGDTAGGTMNRGWNGVLWKDTVPANNVYVGYLPEVTADPVGIAEVHIASTDAATNDILFGGVPHGDIYGVGSPGCTENAGVDLNSGLCGSVSWGSHYFCYPVPSEIFDATCNGPATPLQLHYVLETPDTEPVRCVVVGDKIAVDVNAAGRSDHIYWGPEDANRDGNVDALDADWVLNHVEWLRNKTDDGLVNLNMGTQSYHRWDWVGCLWGGGGWDEGWCNPIDEPKDALYIGVCRR